MPGDDHAAALAAGDVLDIGQIAVKTLPQILEKWHRRAALTAFAGQLGDPVAAHHTHRAVAERHRLSAGEGRVSSRKSGLSSHVRTIASASTSQPSASVFST